MNAQLVPDRAPSAQLIPDRAIAVAPTTIARPIPHQANTRGASFLTKGGICARRASKSRKTCSVEGCTNQSKGWGVCRRHGAKVKKCCVEGCSNLPRKAGLCIRHGARKRPCSAEGCTNDARKGGVCIAHGSKEKQKLCRAGGCPKRVWNRGVCWGHREGATRSVGGPAVGDGAGGTEDGRGGENKALEYDSDDLGADIYQAIMRHRKG